MSEPLIAHGIHYFAPTFADMDLRTFNCHLGWSLT